MGKNQDISETLKARILTYFECGKKQKEIANLCAISQQTVSRISRSFSQNNLKSKRFGRCGRKSKLNDRTKRLLVSRVKKSRSISSLKLKADLQKCGVNVGSSTIRRSLVQLGYPARRPRPKPKLTDCMKEKRLAWALQHQLWTTDDWLNVGFSDESMLCILQNKSHYVRRNNSEELHPDCIKESVKHPTSQMVWSVISGKGTGRLHLIDGTMNAIKYVEVLKNRLIPQLKDWYGTESPPAFTFMQDGAPCHTAKLAMKFLKDEAKLNVLPWPGNSPDMNPIENLWELLKRKIAADNPTTKTELTDSLIKYWHKNEDLKIHCHSLISSMPRRIRALIDAKGGHTKY